MPMDQRAFTLIEILVVLGLLSVIAGLGMLVGFDTYKGSLFRNETKAIIGIITKARAEAIANVNGTNHGVHMDLVSNPKTYTLYEGTSWQTRDVTKDLIIQFNGAITPSGMIDVLFDQLTGQALVTGGDLTIHDGIRGDVVMSVNAEGRIDW